jgi:hypothetical protein
MEDLDAALNKSAERYAVRPRPRAVGSSCVYLAFVLHVNHCLACRQCSLDIVGALRPSLLPSPCRTPARQPHPRAARAARAPQELFPPFVPPPPPHREPELLRPPVPAGAAPPPLPINVWDHRTTATGLDEQLADDTGKVRMGAAAGSAVLAGRVPLSAPGRWHVYLAVYAGEQPDEADEVVNSSTPLVLIGHAASPQPVLIGHAASLTPC